MEFEQIELDQELESIKKTIPQRVLHIEKIVNDEKDLEIIENQETESEQDSIDKAIASKKDPTKYKFFHIITNHHGCVSKNKPSIKKEIKITK